MSTTHEASRDPAGGLVRMPRPPGVLRRFGLAHPRLVDWLLAICPQLPAIAVGAVLAIGAALDAWEPPLLGEGLGMIAVAIAAGAALLWRRRLPLLVSVVCALLSSVPFEASAGAALALYVALFSVGAHARALRAWLAVAIAAVCSVIATAVLPALEPAMVGPLVSVNLLAISSYAVAVLLGISARARRSYVDQLIARASDLDRDRDQRARLAVAAERARIAREMHDVVSHGLTVMVTLAEGSAAQAARDPERASATMRSVADTGRSSLTEMRRLLGVLREPGDDPALAPQPASGDLHALVASFRDAGMPVSLATSGTAIDDQPLALTVHRIAQEALTNVLRHASDARQVDVHVRHEGGTVRLEVLDDGSGAPATTMGAGRGIIGIRERAAMFDGLVDAGPRAPRGWRVAVTLSETGAP
ncbi:sensor histidine kinase [Agrococcus sp. Marseille-P2731]|uniref:sensor histidine kinase n=1 Tax=Agrococcus sp. Marseille-P2731 TaxID=1841862 RepID=UPI0009FAA224|nr:histidine kinase [Agrococcus sp. Marseille-P2731]